MLKHLSVCAALIAFAMGPAYAQQEAVLQKVEVAGAAFHILVASPKVQGVKFDLANSPDALLVHLVGGDLALGFDSHEAMMMTVEFLRRPLSSFNVEGTPVALYSVPKD